MNFDDICDDISEQEVLIELFDLETYKSWIAEDTNPPNDHVCRVCIVFLTLI